MTLRDDLIAKIEHMEDAKLDQLASLIRYVEIMQSDELPEAYDEAKDPTIGFLSGPINASTQVKKVAAEYMEKKFSK